MHEDILKKLYETFVLSSRKGTGGMTFKYVPNEDVINRRCHQPYELSI